MSPALPLTLRCVAFLLLAAAPAQDPASGVATARRHLDAGQWRPAGEVLLAMAPTVTTAAACEQVAGMLEEAGRGLRSIGEYGPALRAYQAALALDRRHHGDRDHADVARRMNSTAACLRLLARTDESLAQYEVALAMWRRLAGGADHHGVASSLNGIGMCLRELGRANDALAPQEQALAMITRLCGGGDHADVAMGLNNVAACLDAAGRTHEALARFEAALAMRRRLHGDRDHPDVAASLGNVGGCLTSLGRPDAALPLLEASLAMRRRLFGDGDHPLLATSRHRLGLCLHDLGRAADALVEHEAALAHWLRLHGDRDHPDVAKAIGSIASTLESLGRTGEALHHHETALAMAMRLAGGADQEAVAGRLGNVGICLQELGRPAEALVRHEAALAMRLRLHGEHDHPGVAASRTGLASCLLAMGRAAEAMPHLEAVLAARRRLHGDADHADVADALIGVAGGLRSLARAAEALPYFEEALAMLRRLRGDLDHPATVAAWMQLSSGHLAVGQAEQALAAARTALAMGQRLRGGVDHPDDIWSQGTVSICLQMLGRAAEALAALEPALAAIERLREGARASAALRQSMFEHHKRGGVYEIYQALAVDVGRPGDALHAAERSRGRELADLLAQVGDPEAEACRRARLRGDERTAQRLRELPALVESTRAEADQVLHELTRLAGSGDDETRAERRSRLLARSEAVGARLRQLLDERSRLLGDVLPVGRVAAPAEIQATLRPGELLLVFTVTPHVELLYVVGPDGGIAAVPLPGAHRAVVDLLPLLVPSGVPDAARGRDPGAERAPTRARDAAAHELFLRLCPPVAWQRIRGSRRVFVAAHRELHRLPFELLVTGPRDGDPVRWLDAGPPVAYVPSATALRWLRRRAADAGDDATALDLVVVGDPAEQAATAEVPERGVYVIAVHEAGEAQRAGLRPGDVLVSYDGLPLADDRALRDARMATEAAVEDGRREPVPIPVEVWRRGETRTIAVLPGPLGIEAGPGPAREASANGRAGQRGVLRAGELERVSRLPPLAGARAETEAIERVFRDRDRAVQRLVGSAATEPAVFELAAKAKYLHFACHGIADEHAGRNLSLLVLARPPRVLPGDDGLLELGDLFDVWRGRLASCRLVVLSACSTNVGPTLRDEAPQALPLGFLYAGVPSVVCSAWAVDDASTRELMVDFYGRLLAGGSDRLAALTAAKRALRARYPDPFHWAPFLFVGSPE